MPGEGAERNSIICDSKRTCEIRDVAFAARVAKKKPPTFAEVERLVLFVRSNAHRRESSQGAIPKICEAA